MKSAAAIENGRASTARSAAMTTVQYMTAAMPNGPTWVHFGAGDEVEAVLAERRQALLEQEPADEDQQRSVTRPAAVPRPGRRGPSAGGR